MTNSVEYYGLSVFKKKDVTTFPDGIMAMNQRLVDKVVLELEKLGYKRDTP